MNELDPLTRALFINYFKNSILYVPSRLQLGLVIQALGDQLIELKAKDKFILATAGIGALTFLVFGNLSIAMKIGMSISIFSVLFIFSISFFTRYSISSDIKYKLKEMNESQADDYLKQQGLSKKERNHLLQLIFHESSK